MFCKIRSDEGSHKYFAFPEEKKAATACFEAEKLRNIRNSSQYCLEIFFTAIRKNEVTCYIITAVSNQFKSCMCFTIHEKSLQCKLCSR